MLKTVADFKKMKQQGESIVMLTAYDYPTAQLAEQAGVDILLVGDSLGMVVLGYEATNVVTIEDMIHHGKAVKRGAPQSFIVVDMPFGSYHGSDDRALQKAIRLFQETGASALKLEGAGKVIDKIELLTSVGIPIVAHLGLLPQSASVIGGYKVQGKTAAAAEQLIADAQACEAAGARMLVVECIPHQLTEQLRSCLSIPVIGIGAGCADGQVLVFHDVVQYGMHHIPKFVKSYANVHTLMIEGISQYVKEVKDHVFPTASHQFTMAEEEVTKLLEGDK